MVLREFLPSLELQPRALYNRVRGSAVVWSWAFNGARLTAGMLLLPLVLHKLSAPDVGMYFVLLNLSALVVIVDFGFGPTLGRFISYAVAGAPDIHAQGPLPLDTAATPNFKLLWRLLLTMRQLYRHLTLLLIILLGLWGTYCVELAVHETSSALLTRLAWAATLLTACFDIYANWWVTYLRSLNQVRSAAQIGLAAVLLRLFIAATLLFCGAGLLSLPIGSFFGSLLQRGVARHLCLRFLGKEAVPTEPNTRAIFRVVWPNTWRLGMQFLTAYLLVQANMGLCLKILGLNTYAKYGLSVQLLGIISGVAGVWTTVKWPLIGQLYARGDKAGIQHTLWSRIWLQNLTFTAGCATLLLVGPFLLQHFGNGKEMLPRVWFGLMMLNSFLEMQFIIWGTLLFTQNSLVYIWPTVATNVLSLLLAFSLIELTSIGVGALIIGPLIAGVLFNYWYWPVYTARIIGVRLVPFLLRKPR